MRSMQFDITWIKSLPIQSLLMSFMSGSTNIIIAEVESFQGFPCFPVKIFDLEEVMYIVCCILFAW